MTGSHKQHIRVVGALLERGDLVGHYFITQRAKDACFPLLWEFPGGKVHEGEGDAFALRRELKERFSVDVVVGEKAMSTVHEYAHYHIEMTVFFCRLDAGSQQPSLHKVSDGRWVPLAEMERFQFPPADEKTLSQLLELDETPGSP
jgi:8-oxo-dGTP diphosphatase